MIINSIYALIATLGFGIIFNIRKKNLLFASIGGGLSWFFYLLALSFYKSTLFSLFIGASVGAFYSEIMARTLKTPVTTFIVCAIIPLVPGSGMYYSMYESIKGNADKSLSLAIDTLSYAGAIAIGILLISSITKLISTLKTLKR